MKLSSVEQKAIIASYSSESWEESIRRHLEQACDPKVRDITPRDHIQGNLLMLVVADYDDHIIDQPMYARLIDQLNTALQISQRSPFTDADIDAIRKLLSNHSLE